MVRDSLEHHRPSDPYLARSLGPCVRYTQGPFTRSRHHRAPILAIIAIAAVLGILWLRTPLPAPRILATRQITHDSSQKFQLMTDGSRSQLVPVLDGISADNVEFSRDGLWVTYVLEPEGPLWRSRADGSDRLQLTHSPRQEARAH
jgi:hypothetical protein